MVRDFRKKKRVLHRQNRDQSFRTHIISGLVGLFVIVLVCTGVFFGTRAESFLITEVIIEGGETLVYDEVEKKVDDSLVGSYWFLIPKRFTYLYPEVVITETIAKIPRVEDVQVERVGRKTLRVTLTEYTPHALWCVAHDTSKPCYFMTERGYVFAEAPSLTGGGLIRHYAENLDDIKEGQALSLEELLALDVFLSRIEVDLSLRVSEVLHKSNGDYELTVNGGGALYVARDKIHRETFENLAAVLTSKEFQHIEPGNFKYIDARFDNKVYVNEEMNPVEKATSTPETLITNTIDTHATATLPLE